DDVVFVDENAARPAELRPLVDIVAVLIENLDAVVVAVADEQVPARIHRERMRGIDLTRGAAFLAPGLDEFAGLVEFDDAGIGVAAVSVADENVAIGRDQNRGRSVEGVRTVACRSGLAEREQDLAVRAELEDLVALAVLALGVGDPDVAVAVDKNSVRKPEHSGPETCHQLAGGVEFEHRSEVRAGTGVGPATLGDPDTGAVGIDRDASGGAPGSALRHLRPVLD